MTENAVATIEPKAVPAPKPKRELTSGHAVSAIVPTSYQECWMMADAFFQAGMIPEAFSDKTLRGEELAKATKAKTAIVIMAGMELGRGPVWSMKNIAPIRNRPALWGDALPDLVHSSGKLLRLKEWFTGKEMTDDWTAHCEAWRVGSDTPYVRTFSWADAKRAGLTGSPTWKTYPQRMLQMRARSWAFRDGFADAMAGLPTVEEMQDTPVEPVQIDTTTLLSDDAPANDAPQIEHKPTEPKIYTLKDATAKDMGSFDNPRGYIKALSAMLGSAGDADRRSLWHNNRDLVLALPEEYEADRDAMLALSGTVANAAE